MNDAHAMKPESTALILIGFQNDYFAPDGILRGVIEADADRVLRTTLDLIRRLEPTPVTMIATPILFTPDYSELENPVGILAAIKEAGAFRAGTPGGETVPEIRAFGERIIEVPGKRGLNAFSNTDLDAVLRERGIEDVVLAGVVTSICIDSAGRAAHERGYRVHILEDATAGRTQTEQDFYCREIFPLYAEVLTADGLLERLRVS